MESKSQHKICLLNSQLNSSIENLNNEAIELSQDQDNQLLSIKILQAKTSAILSKTNNDPEIEQDFKRISSLYERSNFDLSLSQAYQEYAAAYHQIASLYLIHEVEEKTMLFIYDTESERSKAKALESPEQLTSSTCMARLPNGELFCLGKYPLSGITMIVDRDYRVSRLPSGKLISGSSAIYFNKNVYCFGGSYKEGTSLSSKFDLDENRWTSLALLPKDDYLCNSVIFNRNILISGYYSKSILQYSIDIDSFSKIPYKFAYGYRKILINVARLYLVECGSKGLVYESEIGDVYVWNKIAHSALGYVPSQVSWSYNKGAIYIVLCLF